MFIFLQWRQRRLGILYQPVVRLGNSEGVGGDWIGYFFWLYEEDFEDREFFREDGEEDGEEEEGGGEPEIKCTNPPRCHPHISEGRVIMPGPPILSTPSSRSCRDSRSSLFWPSSGDSVVGLVGLVWGSQGFPKRVVGYHCEQ